LLSERNKALALGASVLATVLVGWVFGTRGLSCVAGDDGQLVALLKEQEAKPFETQVGDVRLLAKRLNYQRLTIDLNGEQATVTATLDAEAVWSQDTHVSSLGLERIPFQKQHGEWVPTRGYAPLLFETLSALEARRRRIENGSVSPAEMDPEDYALVTRLNETRCKVKAWFIRHEADAVTVTEEFELRGALPDRPIAERRTRRLRLFRKEDGVSIEAR
jgi:hypothetical protein